MTWLFANQQWVSLHPLSFVDTLAIAASDHSPIIVNTMLSKPKGRQLKFESYWYSFPQCMDIINSCWANSFNGSSSFNLQCKLQSTLSTLHSWSKEQVGNIPHRIKDLEEKITAISSSISLDDLEYWQIGTELSNLKHELEFLYDCESSFWSQRAKLNWRALGERNTKFFHSFVNRRRTRNSIVKLKNHQGEWTSDQIEIQNLAVKGENAQEGGNCAN